MADTYTLLEKITVGAAGASSVTFTSIPQTYTDLKVVLSARNDGGDVRLRFNGNTSSIYTYRRVYGTGGTTGSDTTTQTTLYMGTISNLTTATANTFGNSEFYIPNYTGSTNKSISSDGVNENNASTAYTTLNAGLFANTSAITSIEVIADAGTFVQYSTFYLYGIAKEGVNPSLPSAPYATGGDKILYDGTYWYHAFTSTGTFTPKKGLSCDILVVAGGGSGGGGYYAGGGGAGGLLAHTAQSLTSGTGYTVTIGAGAAAQTTGTNGNSGSNSQFGSLTASVGGGGGGSAANNGINGGSGGGAGNNNNNTTLYTGGTATSGQGYAGGNAQAANTSSVRPGAGGGGAAAAGGDASGNGSTGQGGAGGIGSSTYSSWGSATATGQNVSGTYYFAGGGGGGSPAAGYGLGGSGGGGNGGTGDAARTVAPANAIANTGGGGGGSNWGAPVSTSGAGGSGIVIVRYAA